MTAIKEGGVFKKNRKVTIYNENQEELSNFLLKGFTLRSKATIKDNNGNDKGYINQEIFNLFKTYTMFDMEDNKQFEIKEKFSMTDTFEITNTGDSESNLEAIIFTALIDMSKSSSSSSNSKGCK